MASLKDLTGGFKDLLFGSGETEQAVDPSTRRYISEMRNRQDTLWPILQKYVQDQGGLDQASGGMDQAFAEMFGNSRGTYDKAISDTQNFNLDPQALNFLTSLRDERINSTMSDVNNLIGSKVSDLARRGVLSSSTAEGSMGEVGRAVAPVISQANQDYYNSRLNLPGQVAGQTVAMRGAGDTGLTNTMQSRYGAASQRYSDRLNPYLQMWNLTAAPAAMSQGQTGSQPTQGILPSISSMLGSFMGAKGGAGAAAGCWVAREAFGQFNPRWMLFREWLVRKAPAWFRALYNAYGPRVAEFIRNKPRLVTAVRSWMNRRIDSLEVSYGVHG